MNLPEFGKHLRFIRKKKGFTQHQFAEILEISPEYVSKIENGRAGNLGISVVCNIADQLGMTTDYILGRIDHEEEILQELMLLFAGMSEKERKEWIDIIKFAIERRKQDE